MKLIKILFVAIIALVIGNVTLTNQSIDEGEVIAGLSRDITSLQNQNTILRAQVASSGALVNLNTKLAEAGFIDTQKVASLPTVSAVASR